MPCRVSDLQLRPQVPRRPTLKFVVKLMLVLLLFNRFNNQKSYLDKPANPPSTTESEEASTEDDEVETKMMSARTSSPSRVNYPGKLRHLLVWSRLIEKTEPSFNKIIRVWVKCAY